jgi:hypothetical protein
MNCLVLMDWVPFTDQRRDVRNVFRGRKSGERSVSVAVGNSGQGASCPEILPRTKGCGLAIVNGNVGNYLATSADDSGGPTDSATLPWPGWAR